MSTPMGLVTLLSSINDILDGKKEVLIQETRAGRRIRVVDVPR